MTDNRRNNQKVSYRGKFISVVLQPSIGADFWQKDYSDKEISEALMRSGFPLYTEVMYALQKATAESLKGKQHTAVEWAFGTETSNATRIPHYQIYMEFPSLIKRITLYESFKYLFGDRVHIVTQTVYNNNYKEYCIKESSNFNFDSPYYWNIKKDSQNSIFHINKLLHLRPKLNMIHNSLFTGQRLLKQIATCEPDDRTGVWLADVIGGTGKTAFFQTIVDEEEANGIYLRISDGMERLSAKLRKKISLRLKNGRGYPRFIWINFGRTLTEDALRQFADFGEQILDGMLDDNFGNTSDGDFMALPYVNLIVTANTPPNIKQLTGDRIKLLTLYPIYDATNNFKLIDSLLIPIYVEIKVRILKRYPNNLEYKYIIRPQDKEHCEMSFRDLPWYESLLENMDMYSEFINSDKYAEQKYQSRMDSGWISANANKVQQDVFSVYIKALHYTATMTFEGSGSYYSEATNFQYPTRHYKYSEEAEQPTSDTSLGTWNLAYNKIPD